MVPFPDPGAPTISAQILPPPAVDEFLLDEATEEGDPHQKAAPHMGGRRTRVDSMAKIRMGERRDLLKRNNERRQFHFLTAFFPCGIHFARFAFTFHLPEFVECVVDSSQVVRNTPAQREELVAAQTLKAVERHFRLSSREAKNYTPFPNYYAAFAPFTLACIVAFILTGKTKGSICSGPQE